MNDIKAMPNYYSILPASVRYDNNLKPNEKLLYSEISALCNKNGYCNARNEYFAKLYQVHKNTVSVWINNLQQCGYIGTKIIYKEESHEVKERIIFLSEVILREIAEMYCKNHKGGINEIIDRYLQKHLDPINENLKDNNTSINNNSNSKDETKINDRQFEMPSDIFSKIFPIIEKEFGRLITPLEIEMIRTWDYSVEILKLAVSEASTNGQFSMRYIDKIIYNWKKANVRTVDEARKYIKNFHERKERRNFSVGQASNRANDYGSYEVLV